jgi:hypothetical protein
LLNIIATRFSEANDLSAGHNQRRNPMLSHKQKRAVIAALAHDTLDGVYACLTGNEQTELVKWLRLKFRGCIDCSMPLPLTSGNAIKRCRSCRKAKAKADSAKKYLENAEHWREVSRQWRTNHRVEHRAASKRWRETHREQRAAYYRRYYEQNKDKIRRQQRAWWERTRALRPNLPPSIPLEYPYVQNATEANEVLIFVASIVPRHIGAALHADVCQEIMLSIWLKKITPEELKANPSLVNGFIRMARRQNLEAGGNAISLSQPRYDGRSWDDILAAEVEEEPEAA